MILPEFLNVDSRNLPRRDPERKRYVSSVHLQTLSAQFLADRIVGLTSQLFLKFVSSLFDSLAGRLEVVHRDTNVTKALGVFITVVRGIAVVVLCPIVVGELENAFTIGPMRILRGRVWTVIC
jgi:hypothetical protein